MGLLELLLWISAFDHMLQPPKRVCEVIGGKLYQVGKRCTGRLGFWEIVLDH